MMYKKMMLTVSILMIIAMMFSCQTKNETEAVNISGRVVEIVDGDYIIIRNEENSTIYYKIDISGGMKMKKGVSAEIHSDSVISVSIEMLNENSLPKEVKLVEITENKFPEYSIIDAQQAKKMMDEGNVIILDVRTKSEYDLGHIPDAYILSVDMVKDGINNIIPDKQAVILVYCKSGNRSKVASRILTEMGYENIYDFGGIIDWPYDIVTY